MLASPVTSPSAGRAGTGVSSSSCESSCFLLARIVTGCEEEAEEDKAGGVEEYVVAKMLSLSESCGECTVVVHKVFRASVVRDLPVTASGFGVRSGSRSASPPLRCVGEAWWGCWWRRLLPGLSWRDGEVLSGTRGRDDIEPTLDKYLRAWLGDWAFCCCQQIAVGQRHQSVRLSPTASGRARQGFDSGRWLWHRYGRAHVQRTGNVGGSGCVDVQSVCTGLE